MPGLPAELEALCEHCAAPGPAAVTLQRLLEEDPGTLDLLCDAGGATGLAANIVAVVGASNSLARLVVAERDAALGVLAALDAPVPISSADPDALAQAKRLELLRIATRDLRGLDPLETTAAALSDLAASVFDAALRLVLGRDDPGSLPFAVIAMGKLGAGELNYASDVDVVFVAEDGVAPDVARRVLEVTRRCFRVDVDLRPEGRSGALTRSLADYEAYWRRWAQTWERQALLKARRVAGDPELGARFEAAAAREVWEHPYSADEIAEVRAMKARTESLLQRHGRGATELKRGPGGIRDVEFSVQLLQLVHGRLDRDLRVRATLPALGELAAAGYIASDDAAALAGAYRFLRLVEHRLQLVEEEQTHAVPPQGPARERLARVLGHRDSPGASASAGFDEELRAWRTQVRTVHERLFFRPLLEAFSSVGEPAPLAGGAPAMDPQAVERSLAAFGFAGATRTAATVAELAGGLSRTSRLMGSFLPLLLDWLSMTPDPDLGLVSLARLVGRTHHRSVVETAFRESPEAARRLCTLLGSSTMLVEAVTANPALIAEVGDEPVRAPSAGDIAEEARGQLDQHPDPDSRRRLLLRLRQEETVRVATRDLLGASGVEGTGRDLTAIAQGVVGGALEHLDPAAAFCVIGLGRFGGAELSYASDLDLLFVCEDRQEGDRLAEQLLRLLHGTAPAERVFALDLDLRPEGPSGPLTRDLAGYEEYFGRWGQTWERQALLRARFVAGDAGLGERFLRLARAFVQRGRLGDEELATIRRMKARIERERIPPRENPEFHLKLGRGSLSDVEWTAQLLQLQHGVDEPGTVRALEVLAGEGLLAGDDAAALLEAYRFCEHARNRWFLVGAIPGGVHRGDALPGAGHQLSKLARSLGTTPGELREDYRRVTRRARRVVERLFYGLGS